MTYFADLDQARAFAAEFLKLRPSRHVVCGRIPKQENTMQMVETWPWQDPEDVFVRRLWEAGTCGVLPINWQDVERAGDWPWAYIEGVVPVEDRP